MKLTFLGAAGTVTGSRFLLEEEGRRLLVDCGLFQGAKVVRRRNWQPLPVGPASIAAVALSHAHIDHSGYLPVLVRDGFDGPIHCTPATADLLGILLPDSGRIQEEDARLANREGFSRHDPALPLYTEEDARAFPSTSTARWRRAPPSSTGATTASTASTRRRRRRPSASPITSRRSPSPSASAPRAAR